MNSVSAARPFDPSRLLEVSWWVFLGVAALALVALTLWAYWGHRESTRLRLAVLVGLRLFALLLALFTACRPKWTIEEKPNVPSRVLIGIDLSRSMTVTDEAGGVSRIARVRKVLEDCQPTLDALRDQQNCEVVVYAFGPSEFTAEAGKYDPNADAAAERSDYATYLRRVYQQWANDKYVRGHLIVGDGADNGSGRVDGKPLTPTDAAAEWKQKGVPVHTFAVGDQGTNQSAKDVAIADVILDPDPVAIKNKFVVRMRANAFKSSPLGVPVKVWFDLGDGKGYQLVVTEQRRLEKETNNLIEVPVDAPSELPKNEKGEERRQIKVKVEIPHADCPGDTNPLNNVVETYLNLNKEGLRVLLVDRYRYEYALLLDALTADKRIDVRKVDLQSDVGAEDLKPAFDFDKQAYDVLILGNVSPAQLRAIDQQLPEKIADRVKAKGMGFMMIGGHATLNGSSTEWGVERGWRGVRPIEDVLPVTLLDAPPERDTDRPKYMVVPEPRQADGFLTKLADTREASLQLWERLNTPANKSRFTGLNLVKPKDGVNTYLWAKNTEQLVDLSNPTPADRANALLVGQQLATGANSRVLVFAAQDTFLWQRLGQPRAADGKQIHSRFWRQLVLWLAKQDQEESNAFARPEFPRLKVNDTQGIKVGLRGPNGAGVTDPKFTLTVTGPGLPEAGTVVPVGVSADGSPRAEFVPRGDGEYTVSLSATGKGDAGDVTGTATAKFLAVPDTSEEMQRTTPDFDQLRGIASAGGGTFHRVGDLKDFLIELKNKPYETVKPTKKSIPDWRPLNSNLFLPLLVLLFTLVLGAEWGLRRWWGLV